MSERIKVEIKDGVADVRLVRTDKMNALDDAMFQALVDTVDQLEADTSVRCVVLSGDGRAFCAGLDMGNFSRMAEGSPRSVPTGDGNGGLSGRTHGIANRAQQAVWGWRKLRVPVIAAVHGVAFGGGFQVMLGADIRIVHPDTKMAILEIKWGLVPDMAATPIMHLYARDDVIRELTYTGRIFNGTEAKEMGFATHVSDTPHEQALAMAREIAGKNPHAIQAAKRMYNALPDSTEAEALMAESVEQAKLISSPNQVEAVMAAMEKRDPVFKD